MLQRRTPRRKLRGHRRWQEAVRRDETNTARVEPGDRRRAWGPALAVDGYAAPLLCEVDQDWHLTTNAPTLRLEQGEREPGRNPSVDGVAASFEQPQADCRGEVVPGGDHA